MEKLVLLTVLMTPMIIAGYLVGLVVFNALQRLDAYLTARKTQVDTVKPAATPVAEPVPETSRFVPAAMAVREIKDGKATVIVRYRVRKKAVTAHLIVWAGVGKSKKNRYEDSYYDLGVFEAQHVSEEIIAKAVEEAQIKMADLARPRKSVSSKAESVAKVVKSTTQAQAAVVEVAAAENSVATQTDAVTAAANLVVVEDGEHQPVVKMKKVPSVFQGIIVASGMMKRPLDDKIIDSFGIRYRTPEGYEDAVWGVDLRRAMEAAKVSVGDHVEILKIGRKTVEKGKAPMNLYQIAKISAAHCAQ